MAPVDIMPTCGRGKEHTLPQSLRASTFCLKQPPQHIPKGAGALKHLFSLLFNIKLLRKMIPNVTAHGSAHPYFMFSPSLVVGYSIQCTTGLL